MTLRGVRDIYPACRSVGRNCVSYSSSERLARHSGADLFGTRRLGTEKGASAGKYG